MWLPMVETLSAAQAAGPACPACCQQRRGPPERPACVFSQEHDQSCLCSHVCAVPGLTDLVCTSGFAPGNLMQRHLPPCLPNHGLPPAWQSGSQPPAACHPLLTPDASGPSNSRMQHLGRRHGQPRALPGPVHACLQVWRPGLAAGRHEHLRRGRHLGHLLCPREARALGEAGHEPAGLLVLTAG